MFYVFQASDEGASSNQTNSEESLLSYNLGGIRMNQAAFRKLEQEISLVPLAVKVAAIARVG